MPDLKDVQSRHNRYIDSLVASFERELSAIVNIAMARTQARLTESLSLADGRIARSIGNASQQGSQAASSLTDRGEGNGKATLIGKD